MKMSRRMIITTTAWVTAAGLLSGCESRTGDDAAAAKAAGDAVAARMRMGVPIEGTWHVAEQLSPGTLYVVSLPGATGELRVEVNGKVLRVHPFEVTGPGAIRLTQSRRGPHEGERFSVEGVMQVLQLGDPPSSLHFAKEPPPGMGLPVNDDLLYITEGLFRSFPVPIPMKRIGKDDRIPVPFEATVDWEVSLAGAEGRFAGDGPWGAVPIKFDKPLRPSGRVKELRFDGHNVDLADFELRNGTLKTQKFGEVEFLMTGPASSQTEIKVTVSQLRKIRSWLDTMSDARPK